MAEGKYTKRKTQTTPNLLARTKTKSTLRKHEAGLQLSETGPNCMWLHMLGDSSPDLSIFCQRQL